MRFSRRHFGTSENRNGYDRFALSGAEKSTTREIQFPKMSIVAWHHHTRRSISATAFVLVVDISAAAVSLVVDISAGSASRAHEEPPAPAASACSPPSVRIRTHAKAPLDRGLGGETLNPKGLYCGWSGAGVQVHSARGLDSDPPQQS